jgi:hypothetical protein
VPKQKLYDKLRSMLNQLQMHEHLLTRNMYMKNDIEIGGVAHQAGTCRFGTDPQTSVLDTNCKAHEVDNLYVVDTSFFPSIGAVNPALTAMANALRVGDHLRERLTAPATNWSATAVADRVRLARSMPRRSSGRSAGHVSRGQHDLPSASYYGLSSTAYGGMFLLSRHRFPGVADGRASRVAGDQARVQPACSRICVDAGAAARQRAMANQPLAYAMPLPPPVRDGFRIDRASITFVAAFYPAAVERAVLILNALLGVGTVLAPVFVAISVGLGD